MLRDTNTTAFPRRDERPPQAWPSCSIPPRRLLSPISASNPVNFRQNKSAACHLCRVEGRIVRGNRAAGPAGPLRAQIVRRQTTSCSIMAIFAACPITGRATRFDVQREKQAIPLCLLIMFAVCATAQTNPTTVQAPRRSIVIEAGALVDGRGRLLRDTRVVVEGSKIAVLDPKASPVDYDLRGLIVLPGWIDSHVHITWSFGENGKNAGADGTTQFAAYQSASNAWLTLMAGISTVQSDGAPTDAPPRGPVAKRPTSGPRRLPPHLPLEGQGGKEWITPEDLPLV